jgi:hypothetical protein
VSPLSHTDTFAEEYRSALSAVKAALEEAGQDHTEYSAEITLSRTGLVSVHLRHASHPDDGIHWRGDPCHRCLEAVCDPMTGAVLKLHPIR